MHKRVREAYTDNDVFHTSSFFSVLHEILVYWVILSMRVMQHRSIQDGTPRRRVVPSCQHLMSLVPSLEQKQNHLPLLL